MDWFCGNLTSMKKLNFTICFHISVFCLIQTFTNHGFAAPDTAQDPIKIQLGGEPSTLDPARVIDQYGMGILRNVVEGLFKLDAEGKLIKGLVESYQTSKDGLNYRFKLRKDALWSDGKPVVVNDFVVGIKRALDPKVASPNSGFYFAIKNAREIFYGKKQLSELGVRQEGEELVIQLEKPDSSFLLSLALPTAGPMRQDVLDSNKGEWKVTAPSTGDYIISNYKSSVQIDLIPNPEKKKSQSQPITYKVLPEEITAMNLFDSGRLDVITTITATEIERLRKKGLVQVAPSTTVFYLSFNVQKPPFNNLEWRRAIAGAVDREGLAKVLNGVYTPISSYLPPSIEGSLTSNSSATSTAETLKAMTKVNSEIKKPKIRFAFGASAFTKTVSEKIQDDFKKKLGVVISMEPMELKTLLARLKSDPPEMYLLGMSAMYDDPMNQLNAFSNLSEETFSRYSSQEYEKLCEQVRATPKGKERTSYAQQANRLLVEKDIALVPLLLRNQVFGINKDLKGFQVSPYQVIQLSSLTKPLTKK